MAIVKGMNFVRGRLGDVGFKQQYVKDGTGYKRRTVAFQIPEVVANPRTSGQVRQRTKFKMVQQIATALAAKGYTYNFYRSGLGISGYNALIRDNLRQAIVETADGTPYIDWNNFIVTKGDFTKKIKAYDSQVLLDDDCNCARLLAWNYDWTCDPNGDAYALNLVGLKINEDGEIDEVVCVQPRTPMSACSTEVLLPKCDCCKTYWFAFFVDPYTGYFTSSSYIGTCSCTLEQFTDDCHSCNIPPVVADVEVPSECPTYCGDGDVDSADITYRGISNVSGSGRAGGALLFPACPNVQISAEVTNNIIYQATIESMTDGLVELRSTFGVVLASWLASGDPSVDFGVGGIAANAIASLGYTLNLLGADISITDTGDTLVNSLVGDVGGTDVTEIFTETVNYSLSVDVSPSATIANLYISDDAGTVHLDADPATVDMPFIINPAPDGLAWNVEATPTDSGCPSKTLLFDYDAGTISEFLSLQTRSGAIYLSGLEVKVLASDIQNMGIADESNITIFRKDDTVNVETYVKEIGKVDSEGYVIVSLNDNLIDEDVRQIRKDASKKKEG